MIVGASIDIGRRFMPGTEGYPAMRLVAAALAGAGWAVLQTVARRELPKRLASATCAAVFVHAPRARAG
jgi:hypothetical protein